MPLAELFIGADPVMDWRDAERMRFVVDNVLEALCPSNMPPLSPPTAGDRRNILAATDSRVLNIAGGSRFRCRSSLASRMPV